MPRLIVVVAIVALAAGVTGAFISRELSNEAAAAPPPPSATKVLEQNLDAGGFIKVHEQGTSTVSGTVQVGNFPSSFVVLVAENLNLGPDGFFRSDWVDTSDCARITVMVDPPQASSPSVWLSPDGVTVSAAIGAGHSISGTIFYQDLTDALPVVAPKAAVAFGAGAVINKAWLFCSQ